MLHSLQYYIILCLLGAALSDTTLPLNTTSNRIQVHPNSTLNMALPDHMKAAVPENANISMQSVPVPDVPATHVLLRVHWTAINRADTLQRIGRVPAPPGVTKVLGLEAAGEIVALGSDVSTETWHVGDKVMALLAGGGNAEYVPVHAGHIMRVPDSLTMREAGGTPETWLTAFQLLHLLAQVQAGDRVLIYAAGSGVGTAATQLAVRAGATVFAVAGSDDKLHTATSLGAAHVANYKSDPDWSDHLLAASDGGGVDVVLDCVGGSFAEHTMKLLAPDSRWVVFGLMGGPQLEGPALGVILRKRVQVMGTTLRARSDEYKTALVAAFTKSALHALGDGLQVVVDRALPLAEINEAHAIMGRNENKGKIVLHVFGDE